MYINEAYLNHSRIDFKDKSRPLIVCNCGTYHLYSRPRIPTYRPKGRLDYQLLYIASGKGHFFFDQKETVIHAGQMVIYRPRECQRYEYYGVDQTEVYWVHFTGGDVKNILRKYGIKDDLRTFYVGTSLEYQRLFKQMIQELQMCREDYEEILALILRELLINVHRQLLTDTNTSHNYLEKEIELSAKFFDENYNTEINIAEYAASKNMSTCWFIRNFKQVMGTTPMQYILSLRITNAQSLLESTDYNITEISQIIGYDNPLYFSRIFKKQKGVSPSEYRRIIRGNSSLSK
ncbi:MAG: helix-turn-helix domain-containing protein [Lachnospiraceae bacterium]|nr:helix-turn-helix domain-containing protein [Lachnospiraceae bacterium]